MARPGLKWAQKPPLGTPVLTSSPLGATIAGAWPLAEGGGKRTWSSPPHPYPGAFVGAPTWKAGPSAYCGRGLTGFTTSDYVTIDPPKQLLGVAYPSWMAILASNTDTVNTCYAFSQGSSSNDSPFFVLMYAAGALGYFWRDNVGTGNNITSFGSGRGSDGLPHLMMGVSYTAADHRLYCDGEQLASDTTALGAMTCDQLTLGILRRTGVTQPFLGVMYGAWCGSGRVPEPKALARNVWAAYAGPYSRRLIPTAASAAGAPTAPTKLRQSRNLSLVRR